MKDFNGVKSYLDINIKHDRIEYEITLDQREYIESLARKYDIIDSKVHPDRTKSKIRTGIVRRK